MVFPSESQIETFSQLASASCFTNFTLASLTPSLISSLPESIYLLDLAHAILSSLNTLSRPTPLHLTNFNSSFTF